MHRALLIDEILQLIFDHCAALAESEPRWTLCQLARCCKAWKDPALNRLWSRIDGPAPLLNLLSCGDNGVVCSKAPESFVTYAERVREISHHQVPELPSLDTSSMVMPRLEAVTLSFKGCLVPEAWALSSRLKRVNVHIGSSYYPRDTVRRSNAVADYLERLRTCAPELQSLQLRGHMTASLRSAVAALTQLTSLTIYANRFLTPETLAAIATFPRLRSLGVHASSIQDGAFADALARTSSPCFPALEELEIRASGSLLMVLLENLPAGSLTKLRVELDRSSRGPGYLKGAFEVLAQKASQSLIELVIEDSTEYEDLDSSLKTQVSAEWYPLSLLKPLAALKELRRFELVPTIPPALRDTDLGELGKWWPSLQHLNLGTFDPDCFPLDWQVQMTPAVLGAVAKYMPGLTSLALPILAVDLLDFSGCRGDSRIHHQTLRSLALGDVPDPAACAAALVEAVRDIFPSLTILDCPAVEVTERFAALVD
ncbi:hypothetical protein PYCCODRAFT_1475856 [Trametes coccinea BRFM310]|uniref:F-box domain-containing protein n=1 Tax=Trametes coccinea (strain BRFM310) TaxID=1353009 RepID=A0A1Y2IVZ5_TRAC3|nr:hypothetical protein PYCCODRAFT_1475856 [Trametes coccinea BRFM310]